MAVFGFDAADSDVKREMEKSSLSSKKVKNRLESPHRVTFDVDEHEIKSSVTNNGSNRPFKDQRWVEDEHEQDLVMTLLYQTF